MYQALNELITQIMCLHQNYENYYLHNTETFISCDIPIDLLSSLTRFKIE